MALFRLLSKAGLLDDAKAEELRRGVDQSSSALDVALDHIDEQVLAEALAAQLAVPLITISRESVEPEAIHLVPRELAKRYYAMPVRRDGATLVVAFANPLDHGAIRAIEFAARCKVRVAVARASEVHEAIHFAYDFHKEVAERLVQSGGGQEKVEILTPAIGEEMELLLSERACESASAVRLVELILVEGLAFGASDIHVEPSQSSVQVRYRIDGVMEPGVVVPKHLQAQLVGRVKVMAGLDIAERRKPQDGSLSVRFEQRRIDVRVSILPTPIGEKIVLRLLDTEARSPALDGMDYSEETLRILRSEIRRPEGMILISGPTGSGKTTTAHAILTEIGKSPLNIVTIENPVEYRLKGITQVEINERQGVSFAGTLRSILRQDPDVIFVGEIRDAETAEIALRAAHTGHLVLSTVHTIDAASSVGRLLDLGVDPWMVSGALRLVIAQRLMRKVCRACRTEHLPTEDERHRLGPWAAEIESSVRGRGCPRCRGRGYVGRFNVSELLGISADLRLLLERRAPESEIRARARAAGVRSLFAQGVLEVRSGRTTIEELLRVIPPDAEHHERAEAMAPPTTEPRVAAAHVEPGGPPAALAAAASPGGPTVPRVPVPEVSPSAIAVSGLEMPPAEEAEPTSFQVLVVDDEPTNRAIIRHCLDKAQVPVRTLLAHDGASALSILENERIHLALVDLVMPGMSGIELCHRLRSDARFATLPVLMLSAVEDAPLKTSAFEAGIDDYLVKPVNAAELIARVTRALTRGHPTVAAALAQGAAPKPPARLASDAAR